VAHNFPDDVSPTEKMVHRQRNWSTNRKVFFLSLYLSIFPYWQFSNNPVGIAYFAVGFSPTGKFWFVVVNVLPYLV